MPGETNPETWTKPKTQADQRHEKFLEEASRAQSIAKCALKDIDEVLGIYVPEAEPETAPERHICQRADTENLLERMSLLAS